VLLKKSAVLIKNEKRGGDGEGMGRKGLILIFQICGRNASLRGWHVPRI